ncbi:hypothetical protein [Kitasatospora sp. NPDC001175]|uniref:hypothetical protein n=1 Tax=Kitasatospora sp. NPDC001175 TaxID=3157103 RepID=UPI003CFC4EA9
MTSGTPSWTAADGADPHPGTELLADLAEDLADPDLVPGLRRHLAECPDCADSFVAFAEVRDLLGAVEAPPLPADIAERIDAALAAEAARLPVAEPRPAAAQPAEPGPAEAQLTGAQPAEPPMAEPDGPFGPASSAERTARPVRGASAPPGRPADRTRPGSSTAASPGPGGPGRPAPAGRRRRGRLVLGAAALIAVLGIGGALIVRQDGAHVRANDTAATAASTAVARPTGGPATQGADAQHPAAAAGEGGPVFQDDQLAAQINQLVAAKTTPKMPSAAGAQPEAAQTPALGSWLSSAVPSCLDGVAGGISGTPLAVGRGRYGGAEVTALVYPLPDRPDSLDVYLVTPSCPGATVVLHRVLPAG